MPAPTLEDILVRYPTPGLASRQLLDENLDPVLAVYQQPKLDGPGAVVTNADDINQCIRNILTCPFGADVLRPEFGSDIGSYIDQPLNRVMGHLVREITEAIERWEPRIVLDRTATRIVPSGFAKLTVELIWQLTEGSQSFTTVIEIS